jgi:hypothetical protein
VFNIYRKKTGVFIMKYFILHTFIFFFVFQLFIPSKIFSQQQNKLAVVITSSSESVENPVEVKGYYIYLSKGKKIKEEINKNAWGWNFEGEYIDEVKVEKVKGEGAYQLFIIENDQTIYESGLKDSLEPIFYKKEKE